MSGGSGIAATLAHLASLAKEKVLGNIKTQSVDIVWAIRDYGKYIANIRNLSSTSHLS